MLFLFKFFKNLYNNFLERDKLVTPKEPFKSPQLRGARKLVFLFDYHCGDFKYGAHVASKVLEDIKCCR
mgnify:CR=1 FL=1